MRHLGLRPEAIPGHCQLYVEVKMVGFSRVLKHILPLVSGALHWRPDGVVPKNRTRLPGRSNHYVPPVPPAE